jgi:hypothetical protein
MGKVYAQDAEYWNTDVPLKRSLGQIHELMMERCDQCGMSVGAEDETNLPTVRVMFMLDNIPYQVDFRCLPIDAKRLTARTKNNDYTLKQANQMGRIAWWWLKSALLMYGYGYTETVIPYAVLPASTQDGKRMNTTLQQQGVDWMLQQATANKLLALPAPGGTR